jgi:glycosyltransferase involved in cell wall biosynthesis
MTSRRPPAESKLATTTVVLCTRNGERYVAKQIESIAGQTVAVDELIVCDDASSDDTLPVVRDAVASLPFTVAIHEGVTPLGVARNFERGMRLANGDLIIFADQDDVWHRHKLERLLDAFGDPLVVAAFSDADLIDEADADRGASLWRAQGVSRRAARRLEQGAVLEQLVRWNVVTGATLAVRASLVTIAGPTPETSLHDEYLALVGATIGEVRAIPEALVRYRLHGRNAVGIPTADRRALVERRLGDVDVRSREQRLFTTARARAAEAGAPNDRLALLDRKIDFLRQRIELPDSIVRRLAVVGRHTIDGSYRRLAHGLRSALRDVVKRG